MKVLTKQPKALFGVFAVMGVLAAGLLSPTPANAETVTLKANDRIGGTGSTLDLCNVAAVGTDKFNNKVAFTAGHCVGVGQRVAKLNSGGLIVNGSDRTEIGTGAVSVKTTSGIAQGNKFDYGFILLDDSVQLESTGASTVAAPEVGQIAARHGHDFGFNVTQGSVVITGHTSRDFTITGASGPGSSGGPVTRQGTLLGASSRSAFFYGLPITIIQRADAAIADATAKDTVGAGFQPI
jgi:hypothetical protein